jgi:hypothetical protein
MTTINVKQLTRALWGQAICQARETSPHPQAELVGAQEQMRNVVHAIEQLLPESERLAFRNAVMGEREPR